MKSKTRTTKAARSGSLHINKKVAGGATGVVMGAVMGGPVGAVLGGMVGTAIGSLAGASASSAPNKSTSVKRMAVKLAKRSPRFAKGSLTPTKSKRARTKKSVKTSQARKPTMQKAIRGGKSRKKK
jgi:hypothetical protein